MPHLRTSCNLGVPSMPCCLLMCCLQSSPAPTHHHSHNQHNAKDATSVAYPFPDKPAFRRPKPSERGGSKVQQQHTTPTQWTPPPPRKPRLRPRQQCKERSGRCRASVPSPPGTLLRGAEGGKGGGLVDVLDPKRSSSNDEYYPPPCPVSFHRRWADSDDDEAENEGGSMNGAGEVSTYGKNNPAHHDVPSSLLKSTPSLPHTRRPRTERRRRLLIDVLFLLLGQRR